MTMEEAIRVLEDNRPSVIFEDENAQKRMAELCQSIDMAIEALHTDTAESWNNHEVACMLAELFSDDCACNYNGIDEWLPMVCDFKDNCQTVGVACWEQFLKHYERRNP